MSVLRFTAPRDATPDDIADTIEDAGLIPHLWVQLGVRVWAIVSEDA